MSGTINVEETIGKTVGRPVGAADPAAYREGIQELGRRVMQAKPFPVYPRGVFKFNSHEEANEWMIKMQAKAAVKNASAEAAPLPTMTSPPSANG